MFDFRTILSFAVLSIPALVMWAVLWSIAIAPILVPSVMIDSWLDKRNGVVQ